MHRSGRTIIVLPTAARSSRPSTPCCGRSRTPCPRSGWGCWSRSQNEAQRAVQLQRPVLLCSYNMADEGLDKKELDTLVMATPKSKVEQCIGRILRQCDTKQFPLVVDVADEGFYYGRLREARMNFYRRNKYETQIVDYDAPQDDWFV